MLIDAVPLLVTAAAPNTAAPSQCAAVASQKVTCPSVTLLVTGPGNTVRVTVAVSVIAVPAATLLADTPKVVVVEALAPFALGPAAKIVPISSTTTLLLHVFTGISLAILFASSLAPI